MCANLPSPRLRAVAEQTTLGPAYREHTFQQGRTDNGQVPKKTAKRNQVDHTQSLNGKATLWEQKAFLAGLAGVEVGVLGSQKIAHLETEGFQHCSGSLALSV